MADTKQFEYIKQLRSLLFCLSQRCLTNTKKVRVSILCAHPWTTYSPNCRTSRHYRHWWSLGFHTLHQPAQWRRAMSGESQDKQALVAKVDESHC